MMSTMSIDGLIRDLMAINRATRSGSPGKLLVTWRKLKNTRTLATLAARTEQRQPAPERRVQSILEQLAKRAESK